MRRTTRLRSYVLVAAVALVAGSAACNSKEGGGSPGGAAEAPKEAAEEAAKEAPAAPKKPLSAIFGGTSVTLPAELAAVEFGMAEDAAKKAAPDLFVERWGLTSQAYEKEVTFSTYIPEDTKKVQSLEVALPKAEARALVEAAWGKGLDAKDSIGKPQVFWFNAEAHLRARLEEGFGDNLKLVFTPYLPYAELLGTEKGKFGWEKTPVLGADIASLRTAYPQWLYEENQKEAEEQRKQIEAMAGQGLDEKLGAVKPSARLVLPPTEWESYETRVELGFDDAGKVAYYWTGVPFEPYPAAKDEILALLKKVYGEPQTFQDLGDTAYLFLAAPRVSVKEDTISNKWDIKIEPAAPPEE